MNQRPTDFEVWSSASFLQGNAIVSPSSSPDSTTKTHQSRTTNLKLNTAVDDLTDGLKGIGDRINDPVESSSMKSDGRFPNSSMSTSSISTATTTTTTAANGPPNQQPSSLSALDSSSLFSALEEALPTSNRRPISQQKQSRPKSSGKKPKVISKNSYTENKVSSDLKVTHVAPEIPISKRTIRKKAKKSKDRDRIAKAVSVSERSEARASRRVERRKKSKVNAY